MLYLIKVGRVTDQLELLKIGFTNNLEQRLNQYKSHNPLCEVISTREGDEILEDLFHFRYHDYLFHGKEWFRYEQEIVDGFKTLDSDQLVEYIWNNKSSFKVGELVFRNPVYIEYSKNKVSSIIEKFKSITLYEERMKFCCDTYSNPKILPTEKERNIFLSGLPEKYSIPIIILGLDTVKAGGYKKFNIEEALKYENSYSIRKKLIQERFDVGKRYLVKDIKLILQEIYDSLGFKRKRSNAKDLEDYFEIKSIQMINPDDKKKVTGYKIVSLK